jgi:hypothetical protein
LLPWSAALSGRIEESVIDSELLRGNPLGDPHERPVPVYLPPGVVYVDAWTAYAAVSSPTRPAPGAITPTSATRQCPGWTPGTGIRWPWRGYATG